MGILCILPPAWSLLPLNVSVTYNMTFFLLRLGAYASATAAVTNRR